ncbi:MAG: hypothetical protein OXB88_03955 [Bacteriovoracales bacterium]|nr:hypothetical protein [Bacteriovoracales bacterium]
MKAMDKLPRYNEWFIDKTEENLHLFLEKLPFNKTPIVIYFHKEEPSPQQKLQIIENYLRRKGINARFPYPVYIVSNQGLYSDQINIVRKQSQIPRYFYLFKKDFTQREQKNFYKVSLFAEKVRNTPIEEGLRSIEATKDETKRSFMISREVQYYENMLTFIRIHNDD